MSAKIWPPTRSHKKNCFSGHRKNVVIYIMLAEWSKTYNFKESKIFQEGNYLILVFKYVIVKKKIYNLQTGENPITPKSVCEHIYKVFFLFTASLTTVLEALCPEQTMQMWMVSQLLLASPCPGLSSGRTLAWFLFLFWVSLGGTKIKIKADGLLEGRICKKGKWFLFFKSDELWIFRMDSYWD